MHVPRSGWLALLACACLSLASGSSRAAESAPSAATGAPADLQIYLLIGQSNMAGRAPFEGDDAAAIDRCFLFDDQASWEPATNPFNRYSTVRKNLGMQKMNPGYGFAQRMLEAQPTARIGLVVNAKGGTRIEEWRDGATLYEEAVKRALEAKETGTLTGVLWHQGEGNASKPEAYLAQLTTLVTNLRRDLGEPDLPFVAGQIFGEQPINAEIAKLPEALPHTGVATSQGLTVMDRWHFDTPSMKELGRRYAEAMLEVLSDASQ